MNVKQFTLAFVGVFAILGFGYVSASDLVERKDKLKFQEIQLKSESSQLKELDIKYDQLNTDLEEASEQKKQNADEVERLRLQKERLEKQKQELEAQLQAKLEAKTKLAQASQRAINTATLTQTASASPAPKPKATVRASSNRSVESIVRQAAVRHGLNPDWFVRLAMCESTMNPNSVNYDYYENGHPSGLFQHITGYWPQRAKDHGYAGASVFNAEANANVTAAMWKSGSHLWECQ